MNRDERTKCEIWRVIPGYDSYEISTLGRLRRAKPGSKTYIGRIRKPQRHPDGYLHARLYAKGKKRIEFIHRLVLMTFVGSCPVGYEANHKNGQKDDNRLENLEWVTPSANTRHAFAHGLRKPHPPIARRGEEKAQARLTEVKVKEIRHMYAMGGITERQLAKRFGVAQQTIHHVLARNTWKHVL